jgi:phosphotransferase system IIB component
MKKEDSKTDKVNLAYVIGVAIGDGNLSNPNGRATRLRVTCDIKYPNLIKNIVESIKIVFPSNKVSVGKTSGNYVNVSCYSNRLEGLLGWKVGLGPKHKQKVSIPKWIKSNRKFTIACLKGLFETDGSIYMDRKYLMTNFVTIIPELAKDVIEMIEMLGFKPNIQRLEERKDITKHTIRISKNTNKFINLVNIKKE